MKAKCKKCGDTVEVTELREYKTCKCGAIGLDYGDGYYYRVCGDPEDFDGEIEGAPKVPRKKKGYTVAKLEEPITISRATLIDNFWAEMAEHFKAIAKLCEERSKQ